MEALALKLLDTSNFALIYFTAYIATNQTYYGNPACHHCKPVWLSTISCNMPYCSLAHTVGFSFDLTCSATILYDLCKFSMSVMYFSRLVESLISDLYYGCICCLFFRCLMARMNKEHRVVNAKFKLTIESQSSSLLWLLAFDLLHQKNECFDLPCLTCVTSILVYQHTYWQYNMCIFFEQRR